MTEKIKGAVGGMRNGLGIALVLSIIAVALYIIRGPDRLARIGVTLPQVLFLYILGGVIAGTIIGLLRAHVTSALSATIVGALAAFPVCICAYILKYGAPSRWDREPWILSAVGALIIGAVGANVFYKRAAESGQTQY